MLEDIGVNDSLSMIVYIMISFSFFVGILLLVSQEAFQHFNSALEREYGIRYRISPKLENNQNKFLDWVILKYRLISGVLIVTASFFLLLIYK